MTVSILDLAHLRNLANDASPGPWRSDNPDDSYCMNMFVVMPANQPEPDSEDELGRAIAVTLLQSGVDIGRNDPAMKWEENANYIAAISPDVLLALLDQLDAAEAKYKRVHDEFVQDDDDGEGCWVACSNCDACEPGVRDTSKLVHKLWCVFSPTQTDVPQEVRDASQ